MNAFARKLCLFAACSLAVATACGPVSDDPPPLPDESAKPGYGELASRVLNGWTAYTSEEYAPIACGTGSLASQMGCTGSNCDNVAMYCRGMGVTFGDAAWSSYFSEENTNYRTCSAGYWMTGLVCRGGNCDDISIECTRVTNRTVGTCRWADRQFSEEFPNTYSLPSGWFARGLACTGSRCDNLRVYECQLL